MLGKKSSGHFTGSKQYFSQLGKRGIILTAEQLQAARAAHWRQKQNPLLTLEDAERWLEQHPLCLFLPRRAQFMAPAPSFVEACLGSTQATPGAAAFHELILQNENVHSIPHPRATAVKSTRRPSENPGTGCPPVTS